MSTVGVIKRKSYDQAVGKRTKHGKKSRARNVFRNSKMHFKIKRNGESKFTNWTKSFSSEIKRISWPSSSLVLRGTFVVLLYMLIAVVFVSFVDWIVLRVFSNFLIK